MRVMACDAEGALAAAREARQSGAPIRLLLLDTRLPGTNFLVLAGRLRELCAPGAGVVLLSGGGNVQEPGREAVLGAHAQVAKPVMASHLLETIQALIGSSGAGASWLEGHSVHGDGSRPLRVLVAEDNAVNRRVITRILERAGHQPVAVANGRLAVAAVAQQRPGAGFDLVLMDVQMPEMDGLEAARTLRGAEATTGAHLPIIALTAQAMKGDRERCLEAGMDGYVSKPIDRDQLFATIEEVMSGQQRTPASPDATPADNAPAQPPAFNRDELLGRIDGDRQLLVELIQVFRDSLPSMLADLDAAVAAADAERVHRAGHALKGTLLNMSAGPAATLARELDDAARVGDLGQAPDRLVRLGRELERLEQALAKEAVEVAA
jgi:two-component system sensor histidine kinase/response regulator